MKTIVINDTEYALTPAYLAGVRAFRRNDSYHSNPHRFCTQQYDDWVAGYTNEEESLHPSDIVGE